MEQYRILSCIFILSVFLSIMGCNGGKTKISNVDVMIDKGETWLGAKGSGPQFVLWVEDEDGNYIATLFVTQRSTNKNFNRPEALPVWRHKKDGSQTIDAVSGATLQESPFQGYIDKDLLVDGQKYIVFLEINNSFDYNDFWNENNSGGNGQPSLIYCGTFFAGQDDSIEIVPNPIGYGSVDGSNGTITDGTENLTTALQRIKEVHLIIK